MINTVRLRQFIGWLGILLPWLCVIFNGSFPQSISITYYNEFVCPIFMIILGSASLLLLAYDGYEKIDDKVNTYAGICGLGICLFPCTPPNDYIGLVGVFQINPILSNTLHTICAVLFFGLLAFNSIFLFTKTNHLIMDESKQKRNIIYKICGYGMISSFLSILVLSFLNIQNAIWIGETFALMFFGISWLTKANCYKVLLKERRK